MFLEDVCSNDGLELQRGLIDHLYLLEEDGCKYDRWLHGIGKKL
jgi:hypothetical protein